MRQCATMQMLDTEEIVVVNLFDVIVIGGGIAGVSVGAELAADRTVCLLEMEASLAFHTTGRSAATYLESYGGPIIRQLTVSSRSFFEDPPDGFDTPLLTPMPLLWLGGVGERQRIEDLERAVKPLVPTVHLVSPDEAVEMCPIAPELDELYPAHYPASLAITTRDGTRSDLVCEIAPGDSEAPMTPDQLHSKFVDLVTPFLGHEEAGSLAHDLDHPTDSITNLFTRAVAGCT